MENKFEVVGQNAVRMEYIEVEANVRLHVTDGGNGKAIVLIPGWPLSDEMYEYQYNDFIKAGFRVIGITLRGFGKSDKPFGSYSYEIFALDIKKILSTLEIKDAVLVGFSMGAAIAIHFASFDLGSHVTKLILCSSAAPLLTLNMDFPDNIPSREIDDLIDLIYRDRPKFLMCITKLFSATQTTLNSGITGWLYSLGLMASLHATVQCLIALRDSDLREDMKKIKIPTLILHGRKDKICSINLAEYLNKGIEQSELVVFEKSGHSIFLEETQQFNEEIIKFSK